MASTEEGCWSSLMPELIALILDRLTHNVFDLLHFASVCSSWRSIAMHYRRTHQLPPLMLLPMHSINGTQAFYSFSRRRVDKFNYPEIEGKKYCRGSSLGWLILEDASTRMIQLFNPVSGELIQLPSLSTMFSSNLQGISTTKRRKLREEKSNYIHKAVLSSDPHKTSNYVVVAIVSDKKKSWKLAYYRAREAGAKKWNAMATELDFFVDVIYHKGLFYAVRRFNRPLVISCDFSSELPTITEIIGVLGRPFHYNLVELLGELCLVLMTVGHHPDIFIYNHFPSHQQDTNAIIYPYRGSGGVMCRVLKLDKKKQEWIQMKTIGNNILFLGDRCSESFPARYFPELKANSIFVIDDFINKPGTSEFWLFTPKTMVDLEGIQGES